MEVIPSAQDSENAAKKDKAAGDKKDQEKNNQKKQSDSDQWEEKRKKTLILKGVTNPDYKKVLEVLEKFDLAKRDEVVRVRSQKVQGKDWAFITMPSEDVVDAVARRSFKLKGTSYYLQKDLSKEVRERLKEAR